MTSEWDEDEREIDEIPIDEPLGKIDVTFPVAIPRGEQIIGEVARQVLRNGRYDTKLSQELNKKVHESVADLVDKLVAEKARSVLEKILENPLQPTDGFGNPVGQPTSLNGFLAARVESWCNEIVDSSGALAKASSYNTTHPRINWALGKLVHGELSKLVDKEVSRIAGELKAAATQNIAKQIAEKISGLVLK